MRFVEAESWTFFVDRSLGRHDVADGLRAVGEGVVVHAEMFVHDAPDTDWLAVVGARGWLALSADKRIRGNALERQALRQARARLFVLSSGNLAGPDQAAAFVLALPRMKRLARRTEAPFIARVSRDGRVDLAWRAEDDVGP